MINLKKILLIVLLLVVFVKITNAQTISVCRTVSTANETKSNGYSCSYVVAGAGLCSFNQIKINNIDNSFNESILENDENVKVLLFPNPFTEIVNIKYPKRENEESPKVCFIDANGKIISVSYKIKDFGNFANLEIYTNFLSNGIYTIRILSGNNMYIVNAVKI